jgi:hypothetical protein
VYGQGMITAAMAAEFLATGEDFRYPATEGGRATPIMRILQRYVDAVVRE